MMNLLGIHSPKHARDPWTEPTDNTDEQNYVFVDNTASSTDDSSDGEVSNKNTPIASEAAPEDVATVQEADEELSYTASILCSFVFYSAYIYSLNELADKLASLEPRAYQETSGLIGRVAAPLSAAVVPVIERVFSLLPESILGTKIHEPVTLWWSNLHAEPGGFGKRSFLFVEAGAELLCVATVPTALGAALVCGGAFAPSGAQSLLHSADQKLGRAYSTVPVVFFFISGLHLSLSFFVPTATDHSLDALQYTLLGTTIALGARSVLALTLLIAGYPAEAIAPKEHKQPAAAAACEDEE